MISPVKIQENINGALQDLITVSDIIETGDNTNGYYVRFADGTQLCWNINLTATPASGSTVVLESVWTYPAAFINTDVIALSITRISSHAYLPYGLIPEEVRARFIYYPVAGNMNSIPVANFATGRWK